ncbi:hypothetical protein Zm00014a_016650 [Zea mays]|uniref:Uncharacterized protein n=1 Tax=Zea mays TaxID=4577 RepID=A0A3L6GBX9_MAIZE|nr:hypothetical protein Zm00014a_016650 [Zea mays]
MEPDPVAAGASSSPPPSPAPAMSPPWKTRVTGKALAEISIVTGSVLVGELSLLSVLAAGQLVKSHMKFLKRASIHRETMCVLWLKLLNELKFRKRTEIVRLVQTKLQ